MNGQFGNDPNGQPATNNDPQYMLSLILGALQAIQSAGGGGGGGGGSVTQGTVPWVVSNAGTFAVQSAPTAGALTDRSGTIAAGGTAQQVAAANATRKYLFFQNNSDTDMWINFGVVAVANQPSILVKAGANYENPAHFCQNALISVMCATTGKTFTAKEA
jgi:hypothetical protein